MNDPVAAPMATLASGPHPAAIAIIEVHGADGATLAAIVGGRPLALGARRLVALWGVDEVLVARPSSDVLQIMPHGGPAIVALILRRLAALGVTIAAPAAGGAPPPRWPEAADLVEALMLDALGRAASPRAIDLLLEQPRRWRSALEARATPRAPRASAARAAPAGTDDGSAELDAIRRRAVWLRRLLVPPRVAIVGAANIGKSTLINRLAGREVAIALDLPGTTRDVVATPLVIDGVAVLWQDTPGIRAQLSADAAEHAIDRQASELAARQVAAADLIVAAADAEHGWPAESALGGRAPDLRIALRADLGAVEGAECAIALPPGRPDEERGIEAFVTALRRRVVPDDVLDHPGPWWFDDRLAGLFEG
ncbi:MAG TPA: 50S ribosome-binding GTPase [Phycisphaerales bacterium]|nr:50S ribosome-binding GTPase [Phycisphaerales bacterium]HMP36876.1 50S ribosome-binding GTPase [Phycisphaerales bacterium]